MTEEIKSPEGVIQVEVKLNPFLSEKKFSEDFPFKVISRKEFAFELRVFCRDYIIEKLADLGSRIPEVIEIEIIPKVEKDLAFCNVSINICNYDTDFKVEEIQNSLNEEFMDEFFNTRIMYLLTQRVVAAEKKRAA